MSLAANMADKVLLWIHGRRLGLTSDGQGDQTVPSLVSSTALVVDGIVVASTRSLIVKAAAGSNGAGAVTVAGTIVGDNVISVTDMSASPPADVTSSFESTITVAGQVQQSSASNLSSHGLLFTVQPQS